MVATNTGDSATDAANLNAMASMISPPFLLPYELVLIRSYGAVGPTAPAWNTVAQAIQRLGGTRTVFNRLEASKITTEPGYSFVGALDDVDAAQASQPLGDADGRLAGVMGRNRTARFDPTLSDPAGTAEPDLVSLVYQSPQAFPAFGTAGLQGANAYITRKLFTDAVSHRTSARSTGSTGARTGTTSGPRSPALPTRGSRPARARRTSSPRSRRSSTPRWPS